MSLKLAAFVYDTFVPLLYDCLILPHPKKEPKPKICQVDDFADTLRNRVSVPSP